MFLHPVLLSVASLLVAEGADERYEFILGLSRKGMHEMVVREAGDFLDAYPRHGRAAHARYCLANAQFELGQYAPAGEHYERLADLDAEDFEFAPECAFRWGRCELEQDHLKPAQAAFARALESGRDYLAAPAHYFMGEALFRAADFKGAAPHYQRSRKLDAKTYGADAEYGLVWCAFRGQAHEQVVQRVQAFLPNATPERQGEFWFLAGESSLELGDAEGALAAYGHVESGEFHDDALRGAGFAAAELGRHDDAARWFAQLVEAYPRSPHVGEAALHRGVHLFQGGQHAQAETVLSDSMLKDVPEAALWRAQAQRALGHPEAALATLDGFVGGGVEGEIAERLRSLRGEVLLGLGRSDEAAQAFEQAGSVYALHAAAIAELHAGRYSEAEGLARRLLSNGDESPYRGPAQLTLAEALFEQERYGDARAEFEVALPLNETPEHRARCLARIAWCHYLLEDYGPAMAGFARVVEEHPDAAEAEEALFMALRCAELGGDGTRASEAGREYLTRYENGEQRAEVYLVLSRVDPENAQAWLEALIAEEPAAEFLVQAHLTLGEQRSAVGEFPDAGMHYGRVLELGAEPEATRRAAYGLAWCEYNSEDYDGASAHLVPVVQADDADPAVKLAALELLLWSEGAAGRPGQALAAYRAFAPLCENETRRFDGAHVVCRALGAAERFTEAQGIWSGLLESIEDPQVAVSICVEQTFVALQMGTPEIADAHARAAHEFAPGDPALAEALFFVGEGYFDGGQLEQAVGAYGLAAIPGAPTVCQALYKLGFAQLELGRTAEAAAAFETIVNEQADCELAGESRFLLGEACFRQGQWRAAVEALEVMRKASSSHAALPKALFRLGLAYGELEEWDASRQVLADLIRKHPEFEHGVEAELWRGRALCRLGDERGARAALARVLEGDQGVFSARARLELGQLALAGEDHDAALSEFLKVAVLYAYEDEVSEALYRAGGVLELQGQTENARKQYDELIKRFGKSRFAEPARQRMDALTQR